MNNPTDTPSNTPKHIVSTDLDGTLLDHHNYSWQAAESAIRALQADNIPIIFNTSKTLAEALSLQAELGISGPVIVENGSAIALPKINAEPLIALAESRLTIDYEDHTLVVFGAERKHILDFIAQQKQALGEHILEHYGNWPLNEIADHTGLSLQAAEKSAAKSFSEPFIWKADEQSFSRFSEQATTAGWQILKGGRFYHLQGQTNKALPLLWLKEAYQTLSHSEKAPTCICLGDNNNDIHMLDAADIPVCVRSPVAPFPSIAPNPQTILTQGYGPEGWCEAINQIMNYNK